MGDQDTEPGTGRFTFLSKARNWLRKRSVGNIHAGMPETSVDKPVEALDMHEISCLVRYATDHGLDAEKPVVAKLAAKLHDAKRAAENRQSRPKGVELPENETLPMGGNPPILPGNAAQNSSQTGQTGEITPEIARLYVSLCKTTYSSYQVSGRTIRDSAKFGTQFLATAQLACLCSFILGILPQILDFVIDRGDPKYRIVDILTQMQAFFWGAAGASVFMLKYLSEKASNSQFDARRLQGVSTRVLLGATLAFVVVNLLKGTHLLQGNDLPFLDEPTPAAVAFLVGLGFKVVYSALEWTISGMKSFFSTASRGGD